VRPAQALAKRFFQRYPPMYDISTLRSFAVAAVRISE
jgi:hypothetical protein